MSLGRVVVGYRSNDRQRLRLIDEYGVHSVSVGRCIASCGYDVFFVQSGQDAVRFRDAQPICSVCYERDKHYVQAEL